MENNYVTNEIKNGVTDTSLSFFYRRANASEWTREDADKVLARVLTIKGAQLHKSIYYGLELIHRITRFNTHGAAKFRDYVLERLSSHSISFATQHLEMIADFNMHGQTNGVLGHYYGKCFDESTPAAKRNEAIADFVNFALVHSYVTGVNNWLATIFVDIEEAELANGIEMSDRLVRINSLIDEVSIARKGIRDDIHTVRELRKNEEYTPITEQFAAVPITMDDSDRVAALEALHNTADTLVEQLAPVK
jgi:hypothetical protein